MDFPHSDLNGPEIEQLKRKLSEIKADEADKRLDMRIDFAIREFTQLLQLEKERFSSHTHAELVSMSTDLEQLKAFKNKLIGAALAMSVLGGGIGALIGDAIASAGG